MKKSQRIVYTKENCPKGQGKERKMRKSILLSLLIVVFCGYMVFSLSGLFGELSAKKDEKAGYDSEISETEDRIAEKGDSAGNITAEDFEGKDVEELLENEDIKDLFEQELYDQGYGYPGDVVFEDISGS